ncbi:MAG: hypothetical protein ACREBG_22240 [Pyrinomonadaceae bacterium]
MNLSQRDPDKASILVGRVLAYVDSLVVGAGVGPQYEKFIFGAESKGERGEQVITAVEIVYAFHKSSGPLPGSFFDYSKRYELRVERDARCDETLKKLSYEENEDETGKQLPSTYILRMMDGAPKDLLKPDSLLPCYMLRSGDYRGQK